MIELKQVSVGYDEQPVLQDLNISMTAGKVTTFIGPNGCGKTTLLRAAVRQLPLQGGSISLDGKDIGGYTRKEFARMAAFMPQVRNIPEITVRGLVAHGRFPYLGLSRKMTTEDKRAVAQAMAQTGVDKWADRDLRTLSGGERQRAYLSMALAQESKVIFLDEPTTYLDASKQFELLSLVRELADQGKTIVMVLHDLAQALQYSDQVVLLADGGLCAAQSPAQLYQNKAQTTEQVFGVELCKAPDGTYYIRKQITPEETLQYDSVASVTT